MLSYPHHFQAVLGDCILSCDWRDDLRLVVLIRKGDGSLVIASDRQTLSVPDEWCEHASGLVAFSSGRLIVWPIDELHGGQCRIGIFEGDHWSTATIAVPSALFSNKTYLAVTYGEEWVPDRIDGSLFSDMVTIYEASTLKRLAGVGPRVRKANYQGVLMEVEACCFGERDQLYFVVYDTPYIWSYDVIGNSVKFDPMPVAPSYVEAITVEEKGIHLVVKDRNSLRVYSKAHGHTKWTDWPLSESAVFGEVEMREATLLGKPGGKLLVYNERNAVILDLGRFEI